MRVEGVLAFSGSGLTVQTEHFRQAFTISVLLCRLAIDGGIFLQMGVVGRGAEAV